MSSRSSGRVIGRLRSSEAASSASSTARRLESSRRPWRSRNSTTSSARRRPRRSASVARMAARASSSSGLHLVDQALADAGAQVLAQRQPEGGGGAAQQQRLAVAVRAVEGVEERDLGVGRELVDVVDREQGARRLRQRRADLGTGEAMHRAAVGVRERAARLEQVAASAAGAAPQVEAGWLRAQGGIGRRQLAQRREQLGVVAADEVVQGRRLVGPDVEHELLHRCLAASAIRVGWRPR